MDSKELSSILDCFSDQFTNKNTKTYTKWLEMIAKVLNMLIGLKGNNYYSKVFKRVNYKLSNSTFWVVIKKQIIKVTERKKNKEKYVLTERTKPSMYHTTRRLAGMPSINLELWSDFLPENV